MISPQRSMATTASWALFTTALLVLASGTDAFAPGPAVVGLNTHRPSTVLQVRKISDNEVPTRKMTNSRRQKLGIADDEDEYDLEMALDNNTDPFITKVIAGSFILVMIGLLYVGLIVPLTTDYGEGVCNPALTGGRC